MITVGFVLSVIVFGALLLWGAVAFTRKVQEKPSEASSHYDSRLGMGGWRGRP
jgi:hypothetical protein